MPSTIGTVLSTVWAVSHALQYGLAISGLNGISEAVTCTDRSSPAAADRLSWISPCVPMTSAQFGIVVSIFTIGGLVGSLSSDWITRKVGRIGTFRVAATAILIGSLAVGLGNSIPMMISGRVIIGIGCGVATVTVPIFLAEIAPPSIRRALGVATQLFIVFGLCLGQSLSLPLAKETIWRYVFAVSGLLAVAQLLGSLVVSAPQREADEPTTWGGDEEEPLLPDAGASGEMMSIKEIFTSKDSRIRRGLVVVIVTQLAQQAVGISPVMYFSTRILKPVFSGNSRMIALIVVLTKVPLTILPAFVIERVGSRPILLFSAGVMCISSLVLVYGLNHDSGPASVIGVMSFVASFSVGLGPVVWVVLSEVMPRKATTAAGAVGIALNWSLNFIMGSTFLPMQEWMSGGKESGEGNVFYIFAVTCALVFIAVRLSFNAYDKVDRK